MHVISHVSPRTFHTGRTGGARVAVPLPTIRLLSGGLLQSRALTLWLSGLVVNRAGSWAGDIGLLCPGVASGTGAQVLGGHQVGAQAARVSLNRLEVGLPGLEFLFGVGKNLAGFCGMGEWLAHVAWNHRGVVKQVEQASAVSR